MALNLTLRQLRFLQEVARLGSFTRAGEALHVSQPTVSAAIGEIERQLGVRLFEQLGRRMQLTEAGRILNSHGVRILALVADAERALQALSGGQTGRLVVGASSTPGTYLLPALLGQFRRELPQVEVVLEIGDTQAILDRIIAGNLDLGVVGEATFDPTLQATQLRTETLVLVMAPTHPLARRKHLSVRDLEGQAFILRERGSSTRQVLEQALASKGIEPLIVMELGNTEAVKKSVAAGLGISMVSEHAVELEERAGVLVTQHIPGLDPRRGLYVVMRRSLQLTPLHQRFLDDLSSKTA